MFQVFIIHLIFRAIRIRIYVLVLLASNFDLEEQKKSLVWWLINNINGNKTHKRLKIQNVSFYYDNIISERKTTPIISHYSIEWWN